MKQQRERRVAVWVLMLLFLAGCGQKGDLYLPDEKPRSMVEPSFSVASHGSLRLP